MNNPKFSILVPAYKSAFLTKALESCLDQTFADFELIIVDDASPEGLEELVRPFLDDSRVKFFRNRSNFGAENVVDNWNRCLSLSSGEYIICIGDDDILLPGCLAEYNALMQRYPNLGVYHILTEIIDDEDNVISIQESRPEYESSLSYIWHRWSGRQQFIGDFCFNASLIKENNGFYHLPYAWGSDDISVFIASRGNDEIDQGIANSNTPGFRYRKSPLTISSSAESIRKKMSSLLAYEEWFTSQIENMQDDGIYYKLITSKLASHSVFEYKDYVLEDLKIHPLSLGYWFSNRESYHLNVKTIFLQFIKAIVFNLGL